MTEWQRLAFEAMVKNPSLVEALKTAEARWLVGLEKTQRIFDAVWNRPATWLDR